MKLHRGCDVMLDGSGLVCRQARLGGVILAVFYTAVFAAMPTLVWWFKGPWIFVVIGGLMDALIVPLLLGDLRARYRDTNWLLWIRPDAIWINLRSYQDRSPLDSPSVVEFKDGDIAQLQRHVERYTVPSSQGGSVHYKLESLDVELRDADTSEISEAIVDGRRRRQPEETYLGFIKSTSKVSFYSVSLPAAKVIRIAWSGGQGHGVSPRLRHVLDLLADRVKIGEPADDRRPDWSQLSDAELDDQILALVCAGNRIAAIDLLVRRRGYSITEAHGFVEELITRADTAGPPRDGSSAG